MVVGGRDRMVAMYDTDRGDPRDAANAEGADAVLVWEVVAEDFVYCVALSHDMQYVAYGGTAKKVSVLSARSGTALFEVPLNGVLWCVALTVGPKGWQVAFGGELSVITVMDVETQTDVLQLPVKEMTNDIAVMRDSLCFVNGTRATMFGAGGTHYGWREKPSFSVVTNLITTLLSSEEQLVKSIGLIVDHHPSIVNLRAPDGGGSLLSYVVANTNHPGLLERLMHANCLLSMPRDRYGRSLLNLAVENGKWHSLRLIIDALQRKAFSDTPEPMRVVNEALRSIAYKYPLVFLRYISTAEMQLEPEVLGEVDAADVMLSGRLMKGSQHRSPKHLWRDELQQHRVMVSSFDRMDQSKQEEQVVMAVEQIGSGETPRANGQARRRRSSVKGLAEGVLAKISGKESPGQMATRPVPGALAPAACSVLSGVHQATLATQGEPSDASAGRTAAISTQPTIELGYPTVTHTGVQARRVLLEDFAALPEPGTVAPLQLVVEAVQASTRADSYSVFGSELVEILLDFKWHGFARRKYFVELTLYVVHVVLILIWNIMSNEVVVNDRATIDEITKRLAAGEPRIWMVASLFGWTTFMCLNLTRLQLQEFRRIGMRIFMDPWKALELLYIIFQLLVNVLFFVNQYVYESVLRPGNPLSWVNMTEDGEIERLNSVEGYPSGRGRALADFLNGGLFGPHEAEFGGGFNEEYESVDGSFSIFNYSPWHQVMRLDHAHARMLRGAGGGGSDDPAAYYPGGLPTGLSAGAYVVLQALVALSTWLRLLYYFKGILRLGTLVHTMQRIVVDIYPLLLLIGVLFIAFWSSIWMVGVMQAHSPPTSDDAAPFASRAAT